MLVLPYWFLFVVRQDLGRETCELFYRKVNLWDDGDPPPSFVSHFLKTNCLLEYLRVKLLFHKEVRHILCCDDQTQCVTFVRDGYHL